MHFGIDEHFTVSGCYVEDMRVGIDLEIAPAQIFFMMHIAETYELEFMIFQYFVTHHAFFLYATA
jgi:hypothetical protein